MDNFVFHSPTEFVFGVDTEKDCGKYISKYGGKKVLIHYGSGSAIRSGLISAIEHSLNECEISYVKLGGVLPNPRDTLVYKGIDICRAENIDFILAVGGGSVIDSAKAIAVGALYEGDFWDFYGTGKRIEKALPVGTVLTIAAAGSEGSGGSVITKEDGMKKRDAGSDLLRPRFSVLNPALTQTLSSYQTACGATDIMAHVFERYFTNTKDVEITDRLCEAVLLTMIKETPRALKSPDCYEARANIMWAGTVAHNDIVGVGRSQDWNSHRIEHELSGMYDVAHGAGLAVVMPAWMEFVCSHNIMRFAQMAVRIFGCEMNFENPQQTALEGISRFRRFLHEIGMPINFRELGAKCDDIPTLAKNCGVGEGKTWGFVQLTTADIEKILKIAENARV